MKLISLGIRGAIGLKPYGDQVDIDYSHFDPGPIAIVGPNGSGKSSLLESSHPWPTLVSRGGSLKHHFHLRDSHRILELEYGGHIYKSKILIDAKNGKMEGYLYRDGEPLNDGKIPSYEEKIDEVFGSKLVFFKSVFAGQGVERLTALTPGMAKEFFIGLLGLDRYEALAKKAKEKAEGTQKALDKIQSQIESLTGRIETNQARISEREEIESKIAGLEHAILDLEKGLRNVCEAIKETEASQEKRRQLEASAKALEKDLSDLRAEEGKLRSQKAEALIKIASEQSTLQAEIDRLQKILANAENIRQGAARLEHLNRECAEFDSALSQIQTLQKRKAELDLEHHRAVSAHDSKIRELKNKIEKLIDAKDARLERLSSEKARLEREIADKEKLASGIETVPCQSIQEFVSACPLLVSVRTAKDGIPDLVERLAHLIGEISQPAPEKLEIDALYSELDKLEENPAEFAGREELDGIPGQIGAIRYQDVGHAKCRKDIAELSKTNWPALIAELDRAEVSLEEKSRQVASLSERESSTSADFDGRIESFASKISAKDLELLGARTHLDMLPNSNLAELAENRTAIEKSLAETRTKLGQEQGRLSEIAKIEAENAALSDQLNSLRDSEQKASSDLCDWNLLEKAFGKNGLQALELDAAGPAISGIATEMIQSFGREWAIQLSTLEPSADGKKDIETFKIKVSTPRGVENFDDLSGGEKVWVEESLRRAVQIYLTKNSGRDYRTLFQDESDGPLDPDRAQAFLDTSLRAHELTGAHHTLIITQRPEIWQRIDQRIELDPVKGAIKIVQGG